MYRYGDHREVVAHQSHKAEVKLAATVWPQNPALESGAATLLDQFDQQGKALKELDVLLEKSDLRGIEEKREIFAAAVANDPARQERLRTAMGQLVEIERALERAHEYDQQGSSAQAWQTVEPVSQKFPADPKLTRAVSDYSMRAPDYVKKVTAARASEAEGSTAKALGLYLAAYGSKEWYEMVQYAIQTADELGLEFTIMNCPGWATGGGPWISLDQSMKQLTWSETSIVGPGPMKMKLAQPPDLLGYYREIAVLAIPEGPEASKPSKVSIPDKPEQPTASLMDGKASTVFSFPKELENPAVLFTYEKPTELQLLEVTFPINRADKTFSGVIESSDDGVTYRPLRPFEFQAPKQSSEVLTFPFPATTARYFRVSFMPDPGRSAQPVEIADLKLSNRLRVENAISKSMAKSIRPGLPWPGVFSLGGAVRADQVLDLTDKLASDGTLDWTAPEGRWTILRLGYTTTGEKNHPAQPEATGLEADKMDAAAVRFHAESSMGKILADAGPLRGKTLSGILIDSWEASSQNWTKNFPEEFQKRRGYDMRPFFPALAGFVVNSQAETEAFLADFRLTASELIARNFYGELRDYAHENGLHLYVEPYTCMTYNPFHAGEYADTIMGEFWIDGFKNNKAPLKQTASMVHTQGRTILGAEAFTARVDAGRWLQMPANLKIEGDQALAHGLNKAIFHTYTHQPDSTLQPGFSLGRYGTQFGRTNTWWPWVDGWINYLSRCQYLLQQGLFVADFLVLIPDEVDGMMEWKNPAFPPGYQYDFIAPARLLETVAKDGKIVLPNGAPYRAVFLPPAWTADLATLAHLQKLVDQGATVVGPPPMAPAGLKDRLAHMSEWQTIVDQLWGASPKKVLPSSSLEKVVSASPPDFSWRSAEGPIDLPFIHRREGETDLYFVSNPSAKAARFTGVFRVTDRVPELWDAVSGDRQLAPVYRPKDQHTEVDLSLPPGGSVFVVFRQPLPSTWLTSMKAAGGKTLYPPLDFNRQDAGYLFPKAGAFTATTNSGQKEELVVPELGATSLPGPWQVEFKPVYGPSFQRTFTQLSSWSENPDPEIKYFSGPATYRYDFTAPEKQVSTRWILDLGDVHDLAEVRINGKPAGVLWTGPFSVDVTDFLQPGTNQLEVTVANRWVNRMIGDALLPPDAKYQVGGRQSTVGRMEEFPEWYLDPSKRIARQRKIFATWQFYNGDEPLLRSGLLGPVKLRAEAVIDPRKT